MSPKRDDRARARLSFSWPAGPSKQRALRVLTYALWTVAAALAAWALELAR